MESRITVISCLRDYIEVEPQKSLFPLPSRHGIFLFRVLCVCVCFFFCFVLFCFVFVFRIIVEF